MQEILDSYSSSSVSTVQSLPGKDNHLYAKIVLFAHGRGHAFLVYWLRNTDFVSHCSRAHRRNCYKSCQNWLFHFWHSCISQISCIAVWDSKRTSFSQSLIYTGKGRMTWNTTNWKPLFIQSSGFPSIPFCFTVCEVHNCQFLIHVLCNSIQEKFWTMLSS